MAFIDERLPINIERGSDYGLGFKTTILELESGYEQRNKDWSIVKGKGDVGYSIGSSAGHKLVRDHHMVMNGKFNTFPFKDWFDYEIGDVDDALATKQLIALGDDATTVFQAFKSYPFGTATPYSRPINLPILTTVRAWIDAVELTRVASAPSTGEFSITRPGGVITTGDVFASTGGSGPSGEEVLSIVLEYDNLIRYDIDRLMPTLEWEQVGSIPNVPIVEVRYTP